MKNNARARILIMRRELLDLKFELDHKISLVLNELNASLDELNKLDEHAYYQNEGKK